MVVGVFPALKLGVLFIKQISKPLAKVLINQAKSHHVFRTYFIIPPAQFYHWAEVKAKMYLMNLGKPTKVAKLNETMAIELGANLMGEVIIFSVAGGCLILEYNRQQAKETKKEAQRQAQLQKMTDDIQALYNTTIEQESEIKYLNTVIEDIAKKTKCKLPPKSTILEKPVQGDNNNKSQNPETNQVSYDHKSESVIIQALSYFENKKRENR